MRIAEEDANGPNGFSRSRKIQAVDRRTAQSGWLWYFLTKPEMNAVSKNSKELSRSELAAFRQCFQEFDAAQWGGQVEEDALAGKFDRLAEKTGADHKAGRPAVLSDGIKSSRCPL